MEKVRVSDLTKIRTGKLDANASSEDGKYPFFTCSKEPLRISTYTYDCECVLVAGNENIIMENLMPIKEHILLKIIVMANYIYRICIILWKITLKN